MPDEPLSARRKVVLVVLFVPSVQRDGKTGIDQDRWVREAMEVFATHFGGATAYPKAKGIWRDDEREGVLVWDEPVVVHCYTEPKFVEDEGKMQQVMSLCRKMGLETLQGEVGLVVQDEYFPIRDFNEGTI